MPLFPKASLMAIKTGKMTLSFRLWDTCRLTKGKSYRVEDIGRIRIKDTRKVVVSSITDEEAKRAGYRNAQKMVAYFQNKKPDLDTENDLCFRIEFEYLGREKKRNAKTGFRPIPAKVLDKLDERLKKLDRRAQGITYSAILKEMAKYPHTRIKNLVNSLDRDFSEIRRKLYRLGDERLVELDVQKRFRLSSKAKQLLEHREAKITALVK